MKRVLAPLMFVLLSVATPAHAALFTIDSFDVTLHESDPGLVLWETDLVTAPIVFDLSTVGESYTTSLFQIGTTESALNLDDWIPYDISVSFDFSSPTGSSGTVEGISGAGWFLGSFGYVDWDNPLLLSFGSTGLLGISLSDATFGLPGSDTVTATFTLLRADSLSVPEPSSLLLFGAGAVALAFARKRGIRT